MASNDAKAGGDGTIGEPNTSSFNENLNGQARPLSDLLRALQAVRRGDCSARMDGHFCGVEGKIADAFNEIVTANQQMAEQLARVGQVVDKEGKTRHRVSLGLKSG